MYQRIKNRCAPGPGNIPAKLIKCSGISLMEKNLKAHEQMFRLNSDKKNHGKCRTLAQYLEKETEKSR